MRVACYSGSLRPVEDSVRQSPKSPVSRRAQVTSARRLCDRSIATFLTDRQAACRGIFEASQAPRRIVYCKYINLSTPHILASRPYLVDNSTEA
jgi:hypothetical protein